MEFLPGGYTLQVYEGCFPLSTDSMVLADFSAGTAAGRVLDLGSGCGTLGVLLCALNPRCHVTGLELDPASHRAALENIRQNALGERLVSVQGDLRAYPTPNLSFDLCVSNPPYFSGGRESLRHGPARREDSCTLAELIGTASRCLRTGGDLCLVHRPERLAEIFSLASAAALEPKVLRLVYHREGGPVSLVLVRCRKGGRPGLRWESLILHRSDGSPTPDKQRIYHL